MKEVKNIKLPFLSYVDIVNTLNQFISFSNIENEDIQISKKHISEHIEKHYIGSKREKKYRETIINNIFFTDKRKTTFVAKLFNINYENEQIPNKLRYSEKSIMQFLHIFYFQNSLIYRTTCKLVKREITKNNVSKLVLINQICSNVFENQVNGLKMYSEKYMKYQIKFVIERLIEIGILKIDNDKIYINHNWIDTLNWRWLLYLFFIDFVDKLSSPSFCIETKFFILEHNFNVLLFSTNNIDDYYYKIPKKVTEFFDRNTRGGFDHSAILKDNFIKLMMDANPLKILN